MPCRSSGRGSATARTSADGGRPGSSAAWRCCALGGIGAALATAWMATHPMAGIALAVVCVSAASASAWASAGTTLLVLLAKRVDERAAGRRRDHRLGDDDRGIHRHRRDRGPVARSVLADPAGGGCGGVSSLAMIVTLLAVWGIEGPAESARATCRRLQRKASFRDALAEVWAEPPGAALRDLRLRLDARLQRAGPDPRAVRRHRLRADARRSRRRLSGIQNSGVLVGMVLVALAGSAIGGARFGSLPMWTIGDCVASAAALAGSRLGRARRPVLAAARRRSSCSASPTASMRSPRSAR